MEPVAITGFIAQKCGGALPKYQATRTGAWQ